MKILKSILKIIFVTLSLVLLLLIGSALTLLYHPQSLLTPKFLQLASSFSGYLGGVVSWKDMSIDIRSHSLFHKSLSLDFINLCVDWSDPATQACFERAKVSVEVAWREGGVKVTGLGPLILEGGQVFSFLKKTEAKPPSSSPQLDLQIPQLVLPDILQEARFGKIAIHDTRFQVMQEGEILFIASVNLNMDPDAQGRLKELIASIDLHEGFKIEGSGLKLRLTSPAYFTRNDWTLQANTDLKTKDLQLKADLQLFPKSPEEYSLRFNATGSQQKLKAELEFTSLLRARHFSGGLSLRLEGFEKVVKKITAKDCHYDLKQPQVSRSRMNLSFECPVRVDLTPMQLPSATFSHLVTIPYNLDFILKSDLEMGLFAAMDQQIAGHLDVEMIPVVQNLLNAKGNTKTQFSGIPSQYPRGWDIVTDLDLFVKIPEFQKVVRALNPTAYAVPAPLNPLKGSVELGLSGRADITRNQGKLPVIFKTDLSSTDQKFKTEGSGELDYQYVQKNPQATLNLDLLLPELKITLPRWGYSSIPALFPDSRITKESKISVPKSSADALQYRVSIKTTQPAHLVSNLAKEDIPVDLDLKLDNQKTDGSIKIEKTKLNFFRRDARVENLQLKLQDPMDRSELQGKLSVNYTDYKINILLLGTVGKPKVIFESDPPLPEEDILSFLIYGRTFSDLDQTKSSSVSSMSAAFANRAIALGSLFLLASTPIESVGYDPSTGEFSAKIRLAEGTSFNVQTTGSKYQQFGIRRTIKGNWIINTYLENDQEKNKRTGSAFIEWSKRY